MVLPLFLRGSPADDEASLLCDGGHDLAEARRRSRHAIFRRRYTFDHLGLDASLRGHLSGAYYEAGHMMYVHPPSLAKLKQDIAKFMGTATSPSKTK